MNRYLLFAGNNYYPSGGWDDFKGDFYYLQDTFRSLANLSCEWWQIVDTETGKILERGER